MTKAYWIIGVSVAAIVAMFVYWTKQAKSAAAGKVGGPSLNASTGGGIGIEYEQGPQPLSAITAGGAVQSSTITMRPPINSGQATWQVMAAQKTNPNATTDGQSMPANTNAFNGPDVNIFTRLQPV